MTTVEFNGLPVVVQEKGQEIVTLLNKKDSKVYTLDPATIMVIIELIIKLVQWFIDWKNAKQNKLNLLQRASLWVTLKFSDLKGASYSDVMDAIFDKLDEETFNALKARKFV